MTREEEIKGYMKNLGISYEEAEQLWEDDKEDFIGDEGEEMQAKAKKNIRHQEQSTKKRKKTTRKKKVDTDKVAIIRTLFECMTDGDYENLTIKNEQGEITFSVHGSEYSLNLVKHRPPKK